MNKCKNYLKTLLLFLIMMTIYVLIISLLYYFELFSYNVLKILNYITVCILFFISGYKISSLELKKGYLNGFLISILIIIPFIILSLIIVKINYASLVYYLSLILVSITGGIIGVQKNSN